MQRICILGCSGSGKSTLTRALHEKLNLPVTHLDQLWWKPNWVESTVEEFLPKVEAAAAGDRWIIDGNYSSTYATKFLRADTVIWIEQPRRVCLRRAALRTIKNFGRTRADLGAECPERFDFEFYKFIWNFNHLSAPKFYQAIETYNLRPKLITLRSDKDIADFLKSM